MAATCISRMLRRHAGGKDATEHGVAAILRQPGGSACVGIDKRVACPPGGPGIRQSHDARVEQGSATCRSCMKMPCSSARLAGRAPWTCCAHNLIWLDGCDCDKAT
eukprot:357218-Chlamydomonas_euryale.AAC.15